MEEDVNELAELQTKMESIAEHIAGNKTIQAHVSAIVELEKRVSDEQDVLHDLISEYDQDLLYERMNEIKDQIIDEWNGTDKIMVFGAGTLTFTTINRTTIVELEQNRRTAP